VSVTALLAMPRPERSRRTSTSSEVRPAGPGEDSVQGLDRLAVLTEQRRRD